MVRVTGRLLTALAAAALIGMPAMAKVPDEVAGRLGNDLTPYGAERAGNAEGTIPEWTGGLSEPPKGLGYEIGVHHPNPWGDEKPLYVINAGNAEEHAQRIAPGYRAMMERFPDYHMKVYPTHRSCAAPESVYDAIKQNATTAQLTADANGVTGAHTGAPFPVPRSALQMVWNYNLAFRGYKIVRANVEAVPTAGGSYTLGKAWERYLYTWSEPGNNTASNGEGMQFYFTRQQTEPASQAGANFLMHNPVSYTNANRKGWRYNPGTRRVIRATGVTHDAPLPSSENLRVNDNFLIFNGPTDRYDWTLVGKKEMIVPYNTYDLASDDLRYDDILQSGHINQDPIRYELHRVWVVEARLREGESHSFARRVNYIDEDTWNFMNADLYDLDNALWRFHEAHTMNYYEVPLCTLNTDVIYDLNEKRYHIVGMRNEEPPVNFFADELQESDFVPDTIRRMGVR